MLVKLVKAWLAIIVEIVLNCLLVAKLPWLLLVGKLTPASYSYFSKCLALLALSK